MKNILILIVSLGFSLGTSTAIFAQKKTKKADKSSEKSSTTTDSKTSETKSKFDESITKAFKIRNIGPALTSGRVVDIAVHPNDNNTWIVAAGAGNIWKTTNHGTTFSPIFDNYGSYSIACVEMAPSNPNTIWVGSGENNNQRSVSYGDGVYKSLDGGASFTNMGLMKSEHIGNIVIHPTNENIVWVAAYGPLWSEGGERGIYKTIDGGKTWTRTLFVSDNTGVSEIAIDPKNPDILYATAHQRRRHEYTYIGGGPESAVYKSTDGGINWKTINIGLPEGKMGRIGIATTLADENYVYAIVEAREGSGGIFLSTNKGESWNKQSSFSTSGNYYQEIITDPIDKNKLFVMDTWLHHSTDAGKNVVATGEDGKHVDNHTIWINPNNTNHWIVGCDGGLYETFNHAENWKYFDNLPIIQFYKVATDNALPFYNVYGGTQDNNSMGGPSGSINNAGILNSDWFITNGGDGFESQIDPTNPNIVYAQSQYGGLVRYDKLSGEKVAIQPLPEKGMPAYRWNWDAPLLISPHDPKVLYFASNKVLKSSNRGDDWKEISADLSQNIDRNKQKVMGQTWSIDAVMKNQSTTIYGNIVALDESPFNKGYLIAGTDDGAIQVSSNDGASWTKQTSFPGVPANTRVNQISWSSIDANVVFALFNNQRQGDFKPYVFKSINKGLTWTNISGNLPIRGTAYTLRQDHIEKDLLFVGTEFGLFFSVDGGINYSQLKNGLPTTAIYDLEIQKRESDLVMASFGRGFYVLDNYSALRTINKGTLDSKAHLFAVKDALLYVPSAPLGLSGVGSQGHDMYFAENPTFGAKFQVFVKEDIKSLKTIRKEKENVAEKDKKDVEQPTFNQLRKEQQEVLPELIYLIKNTEGKEIKRISASLSKGLNTINWNLRGQSVSPIREQKSKPGRYESSNEGQLVNAGVYTIEVILLKDGIAETIINPTKFNVKRLENQAIPATDNAGLQLLRDQANELQRSLDIASSAQNDLTEEVKLMNVAIKNYPGVPLTLSSETKKASQLLDSASIILYGDRLRLSRETEATPSIYDRLGGIQYQLSESTGNATSSQRRNLEIAKEEFAQHQKIILQIKAIIKKLEDQMEEYKVPYIKQNAKAKE